MNDIKPSVQDLRPWELVRVTLEARYVGQQDGHHEFVVPVPDGEPLQVWLPIGVDLRIDRIAPPEWPPQQGDVWIDSRDEEYFGVLHRDTGKVNLAPNLGTGVFHDPQWVMDRYGPLTLDRRRGWARPTAELPVVGDAGAAAGCPGDMPVSTEPAARGEESTQDAGGELEPDLHEGIHPQPGDAPAGPVPPGVDGWPVGGGYRSVLDDRRPAEPDEVDGADGGEGRG